MLRECTQEGLFHSHTHLSEGKTISSSTSLFLERAALGCCSPGTYRLDHRHRVFLGKDISLVRDRITHYLTGGKKLIREAFGWRAYAHRCDSSRKINIFKLNHRFCILKAGRGNSHQQLYVLAARHYAAVTRRHSCKSDPTQKPSNAKVHVWSAFLPPKPGSLRSSTSSFWGADRRFPFARGHCTNTALTFQQEAFHTSPDFKGWLYPTGCRT